VRPLLVVVAHIDAEDALELAAIEDQHPVETLSPDATDPALDVRVRVRSADRCPNRLDPLVVEDGIEGGAELRVAIVNEKSWPLTAIVEIHQQVASLLEHPRPVRVARTSDVLDTTTTDANEDEHVQPVGCINSVATPDALICRRIEFVHPMRGVLVANVIYNPFDRTEIERKIGEGYKLFSVFLDVQLFRQSLERLYDEVRAAL